MVKTDESNVPEEILNFFKKPLDEYSIDELLELKLDVIIKQIDCENKALVFEHKWKYDYHSTMIETNFAMVLNESRPTVDSKKSFCEVKSIDNKSLAEAFIQEAKHWEYLKELLNNCIYLASQKLEILKTSDAESLSSKD